MTKRLKCGNVTENNQGDAKPRRKVDYFMSLTRKMLKAMGIEEEKIEQIIEAHLETVNPLKDERNQYKADAEKLSEAQEKLSKLEKVVEANGETVAKSEYDRLANEYKTYKDEQTEKETKTARLQAKREFFKGIGVSEKRIDAVVRATADDEFEWDENNAIKNADKVTDQKKQEWSDFIETTLVRGVPQISPPTNGGRGTGKTKDEIMAIKDGALRRQEMQNNPHLFGLETK